MLTSAKGTSRGKEREGVFPPLVRGVRGFSPEKILYCWTSVETILMHYICIFIAIALDESIFLDVLHFPMKNIKSRDLEATPFGGATSNPIQ